MRTPMAVQKTQLNPVLKLALDVRDELSQSLDLFLLARGVFLDLRDIEHEVEFGCGADSGGLGSGLGFEL